MALKVYGLRKCTTTQKALAWLEAAGIAHTFQDVREIPVGAKEVGRWSKKLGGWEKMINRAGYTWRGLPAAATRGLDEAGAVALATASPALIRRPLIVHDDGDVTVGFSKKIVERLAGR
jgi:Spx/MgsR family transcriptional regulator